MTKKRILIIGIALALVVLISQVFLNNKKPEFNLVQVTQGTIYQEISESGQVAMGEKINLTFKNAGRIEKIYTAVGDEVKEGQELAELETTDLEIQLQQAKISLELAQLNLAKLLAGASPEEIKIARNQVENAQIASDIAKKNLEDSYEEAITILDSSYPQIYSALDFVKEFISEYIVVYDEDGRKIITIRSEIEEMKKQAKDSVDNEDIDQALLAMRNSLEATFNDLETMRGIIDDSVIYQDKVSSTDKTYLDTLKTNVNSALADVISSQQTISSKKMSLEAAKTSLQEAENRLSLITAESRQVDIDLYQAQIKQAQTQVQLYENELQQSKLISPVQGKIIEIKKQVGELVQSALQDTVMVILPIAPYEVKVNIYEGDVVKIALGNPVNISLVAWPSQIFTGKVINIDPAENIIDGVVYYKVDIGFDASTNSTLENLKPGMTADVTIKTAEKDNVLIIPATAVIEKNGKNFVNVWEKGTATSEREIQVGLKGNDNLIEVVTGLQEGEKVVIPK